MKILLLNAGSSSLKASLVDSDDGRTLASGLADWAGSATRYRYAGPDANEQKEDVSWRGHANAVQRFVLDMNQVKPAALTNRSALAAVGHRVVHGGPFITSVQITPEIRSKIAALADL